MKPELEDKLLRKHPRIFRQHDLPMNQTCMCWGMDCMDGWFNIIDLLCANIQHHLDWHNGEGEFDYNRERNEKNPDHIPIAQVEATQVKEKFGGLRFYLQGGDDYIEGMVQMAEALSERTCEHCGNPGVSRSTGWIRTLCDRCHEHWDEIRAGKWDLAKGKDQ